MSDASSANVEHLLKPGAILRFSQIRPLVGGVTRHTWLRWIRQGDAPRPVKLGPRMNGYRAEDLVEWRRRHGMDRAAA